MFERFTEQSRHVVVIAQDEARNLNHDYVGTEHLLMGLLREQGTLAARVLASLDVTVERVRAQVVRVVGSSEESTSGQIPFTPRAKKVLEIALREALSLGHNYIGTEHVLLSLVSDTDSIATRILLDFGADAEKIRDEVLGMLSGPGRRLVEGASGAGGRRQEVSASLAAILARLEGCEARIPRRRARRLVQDAILRHDFEAESKLGAQAWEAMVEEVLDANPDVEPRGS